MTKADYPPPVDKGSAYTFTGRRYEPEINLYNFRNRYYSAELGRFVSRDPIRGELFYAYAMSNPTSAQDPFGLSIKLYGVYTAAPHANVDL